MKILQLCKKIPYPLKDGESIAIHFLSKGLVAQGCEVHLLAFNTQKHYAEFRETPLELAHYSSISKITLDTSVKPLAAILNLFTSESYNVQRFIDDRFYEALSAKLQHEDFDLVQLETLYMAPYISELRKYPKLTVVMRSHNLEAEIWHNLSVQTANPLKKFYYKLCSDRLDKYELEIQDQYDSLLPISSIDEQKYLQNQYSSPSLVTPIGLDMENYKFSIGGRTIRRLGYIGSLDWKPNIEGINWFLEEVWNELSQDSGNVEFHLAGRNPGHLCKNLMNPDFKMHGEVEDAISFIGSLDVMIVPLFSGSGMRVKIIESMALGTIVLSTAKGFEGIPVEHGKHCFVFENREELIQAIHLCTNDGEKLLHMRQSARLLVEKTFEYKNIAKRVVAHYNELILSDV